MASHIDTFDARGLANSAWAFGKLKYAPNQKLPALIASAAISKLDSFSAQNLSNLLWSFVYLHYRNEELLEAVSKQVHCLLCGLQRQPCPCSSAPASRACSRAADLVVPSSHCVCRQAQQQVLLDQPAQRADTAVPCRICRLCAGCVQG